MPSCGCALIARSWEKRIAGSIVSNETICTARRNMSDSGELVLEALPALPPVGAFQPDVPGACSLLRRAFRPFHHRVASARGARSASRYLGQRGR